MQSDAGARCGESDVGADFVGRHAKPKAHADDLPVAERQPSQRGCEVEVTNAKARFGRRRPESEAEDFAQAPAARLAPNLVRGHSEQPATDPRRVADIAPRSPRALPAGLDGVLGKLALPAHAVREPDEVGMVLLDKIGESLAAHCVRHVVPSICIDDVGDHTMYESRAPRSVPRRTSYIAPARPGARHGRMRAGPGWDRPSRRGEPLTPGLAIRIHNDRDVVIAERVVVEPDD